MMDIFNSQDLNKTREILKQANIKVTLPRLIILRVLENTSEAVTAYDIENMLMKLNQRMSIATIYSTLKLFHNLGLIQRNKINTEQALYFFEKHQPYETIRIICKNCGHVEFMNDQVIKDQTLKICAEKELSFYSLVMNVNHCAQCRPHPKPVNQTV